MSIIIIYCHHWTFLLLLISYSSKELEDVPNCPSLFYPTTIKLKIIGHIPSKFFNLHYIK